MSGNPYFNTPNRIISNAMMDACLLGKGVDPSSEDLADGMNRLNDIINFEQTQGLKLWLQSDLAITPIIGQNQYILGPSGSYLPNKPTRIVDSCYYKDSSGAVRGLGLIARDEWSKLSNKGDLGAPNSLYVDKQQTNLLVNCWMTPDSSTATGEIHLIIQQQVQNAVSLTDTMNFPPEWFIFLRWALASELASGQPEAIMTRCDNMATAYRKALEDWDVEDADTRFAANNTISGYGASSFT